MTNKNASGLNLPVNESQGGTAATTFAQARINMNLNPSLLAKTAGYTAVLADRGFLIHYTGGGGVTLALTAAATLGNGWNVIVRNDAATSITIDPNGGELINGSATLTLEPLQAVNVYCDGTGFYTQGQATAIDGANTALSNLTSPTSVNQDLIPSAAGTKFMGNSTTPWAAIYAIGCLAAQTDGAQSALGAYNGATAAYKNFFTVTSSAAGNATGVIDSSVTCTTQAPGTNNTTIASTAFVAAAVTASGFVPTSRTITIAGTANEITSSAGAQDLTANRTWTLSLPAALTFTGKTVTGGTFSGVSLTGSSATTFTFTTGSIGTAVTAVTQSAGNNSTLVATTAYVDGAISTAVPNPLTLAKGGTNANLTASNGGIFYSTASAGAILSGTATARQMLQSGASGAPAWSTTTWPATTTVNRILYSSSASVIGEITTANSGVLVTDGSGVPSIGTAIPNGVTATTQTVADNSTKVSTTAYVDKYTGGVLNNTIVNGRLTLTSGTPVTTGDVSAAGTLYFTPYNGNLIQLYTSSVWKTYSFTERSIAIPAVANQVYDVFIYDNAGTLTLELVAWTNDTTRATNITFQDGVYCKSGSLDRRYLGTIRTKTASQCNDTTAFRHVWNYYNRVPCQMLNATETTNSWNYTTATYRQANNNTANQLDFVIGVAEHVVSANVNAGASNSTINVGFNVGIGLDSTTTNSASNLGLAFSYSTGVLYNVSASYVGYPAVGRHTLVWLEQSTASGTCTWYGDNGLPTRFQAGIYGITYK